MNHELHEKHLCANEYTYACIHNHQSSIYKFIKEGAKAMYADARGSNDFRCYTSVFHKHLGSLVYAAQF